MNSILLYLSAGLLAIWGIAHLIPTKSVVKNFGEISPDNKKIITMEWIIEGATLIFLGAIISLVTIIDPNSTLSLGTYLLTALMLNVLSIISLNTGFQVNFLPFKLCPVIFTGASILIIVGVFV